MVACLTNHNCLKVTVLALLYLKSFHSKISLCQTFKLKGTNQKYIFSASIGSNISLVQNSLIMVVRKTAKDWQKEVFTLEEDNKTTNEENTRLRKEMDDRDKESDSKIFQMRSNLQRVTTNFNSLREIFNEKSIELNSMNSKYAIDVGGLLKIRLGGDAKKVHGNIEGTYTVASYMLVNGKKNWMHLQGSHVIWYDNEFNNWKIGPNENLGTSFCSLKSAEDTSKPEESTTWLYVNHNSEWLPTSNIFESSGMY